MKNFYAPVSLIILSLAIGTTGVAAPLPEPSPSFQQSDGIELNSLASFIGDDQYSLNIFEATKKGGLVGAPLVQPWSGTFWPLRTGSTGNPYAANSAGGLFGWLSFSLRQVWGPSASLKRFHLRMKDIQKRIASNTLDADFIQGMAPSEKYDLYLGDSAFSFTNAEWLSLDEQLHYIGNIAFWEGSCHGWSTAAIYEPRPQYAINVTSLDGQHVIPFYPDDLKALATRLWANSLVQNQVVRQGARCTSNDPNLDPRLGKVLDPNCQGVNPANFHASVLEMVGARKQSFVVNRSNTTQVWNQPVAGYELTYFNPLSGKTDELSKSIVPRIFYADPYSRFRPDTTKSIVGVRMKLKYISETTPTHEDSNSSSHDKVKTLELTYDLALDADQKMVGGEWLNSVQSDSQDSADAGGNYSDETPDMPKFPGFLWKFQSAAPVAYSIADAVLPGDEISKMDPQEVLMASKIASGFRLNWYNFDEAGNQIGLKRAELRPQPLGKVVSSLIKQARE